MRPTCGARAVGGSNPHDRNKQKEKQATWWSYHCLLLFSSSSSVAPPREPAPAVGPLPAFRSRHRGGQKREKGEAGRVFACLHLLLLAHCTSPLPLILPPARFSPPANRMGDGRMICVRACFVSSFVPWSPLSLARAGYQKITCPQSIPFQVKRK